MRTFVATKNQGKLAELRALFAGSPLTLAVYPAYAEAVENATIYIGNALLKARSLRAQLRGAGIDAAVLSDDSGLEVDALNGRPGVLSARYAGENAAWERRRALLLEELEGVPENQRTARFVCAMVLLLPGNEPHVAIGEVEGRIAARETGEGGFGYDPLFFYPPLGSTFAELDAGKKNAISHRRRAADALLGSLRSRA